MALGRSSDESISRRSSSEGDRIMGNQDDKPKYQASLEFWKATFEYFKTFATICLASIAAYSALLVGFFGNPPENAATSMFSLFPFLSPGWFGAQRWLWRSYPFFAFIVAGVVSLAGTHYCRKALWDLRTGTDNLRRHKWLFVLRGLVWLSYGSATIDFFIIAALSIPLD